MASKPPEFNQRNLKDGPRHVPTPQGKPQGHVGRGSNDELTLNRQESLAVCRPVRQSVLLVCFSGSDGMQKAVS